MVRAFGGGRTMASRSLFAGGAPRAGTLFVLAAAGIAIGYAGALAIMFRGGEWLLDSRGRPLATDFIAIWSAGRLALSGAALSAYDGARQHAAEVAAMGHGFDGSYGWPYPPAFFFVAETLARLPYAAAFVTGAAVSAALHGASVAAIARRPAAALVALAAPWALACVMVGQNGFLTAALIGFSLLCLETRPILSGVLLGLLTYKPHFGLLFPLALAAGGRWRAFASAAVAAVALAGLSIAGFGTAAFAAFLQGLPQTTNSLVSQGGVGWKKLQSLYGLVRALGGSSGAGWVAQGAMSLACAAGVAGLWRSRAPQALKSAALASAAALATPYVFVYDLPVLSAAAALLFRHRAFDRVELCLLALAALAIAVFAFVPLPSGFAASLAIAVMVVRRAVMPNAKQRLDFDATAQSAV